MRCVYQWVNLMKVMSEQHLPMQTQQMDHYPAQHKFMLLKRSCNVAAEYISCNASQGEQERSLVKDSL